MVDTGGGGVEVDVAIVGAGIGGCYVSLRLLEAVRAERFHTTAQLRSSACTKPVTVALFEASDRIGGRLHSIQLPGVPDVWADLGGMRFHRQLHLVCDLIRYVGFDRFTTSFIFDQPENFTYVRGVRLRLRELISVTSDRLPYRLRPQERGRNGVGLGFLAAESTIPGFFALYRRHHAAHSRSDWSEVDATTADYAHARENARIAGRRLLDLDWWGVLEDTLSAEATCLIEDTGGYDCRQWTGNAANWLNLLFHTPPDVEYLRLSTGFESLPRAVHARFQAAGGLTFLRHRLQRLDRARLLDGSQGYRLTFQCGAAGSAGRYATVRAKIVLLTLPQNALRSLDSDTFIFTCPIVRIALDAVKAVPAYKLFLVYPAPWWEQVGVSSGRSTTDLPLRQLWYWGTATESHRTDRQAILLAAYPNGSAASFWDKHFHDRDLRTPSAMIDSATVQMTEIQHAHAMAMQLHGMTKAPPPIAACWENWPNPDGAWHVWRPGYDSRQIIPRIRRPSRHDAVFIISDCWTDDPGSVNGTLSSAESVLQYDLGLTWPHWLRRDGTYLIPTCHPT
jgi:monoamine oxidase